MNNKKILVIKSLIFSSLIFIGAQLSFADTYNNDLRIGSTGSDVVSLQAFLESNGFLTMPSGVAKGYFGQITLKALVQYQKSINLPAFGFFGPMTRKYINDQENNNASPLKITSPNGGEVWQKGTTQAITWKSPQYFRATYADIKLQRQYVCAAQVCPMIAYAPYTIASGISINNNSYTWKVGDVISYTYLPVAPTSTPEIVPDGEYSIQICETGTTSCDSSDKTFTITSATTTLLKICPTEKITNKMPTVVSSNNNSSNSTSTYYILNGQRREVSEFDSSWLATNCTINEQIVY